MTDVATEADPDAIVWYGPSELVLYAYLGEDELGSGEIGLKQGLTPAGMIPLVALERHKLERADIVEQLQAQANTYGKHIRLVRFEAVEDVLVIVPEETK